MRVEHLRQMHSKRGEIFIVAGPVFERDVEIADFLPEREVVSAVHREGEHRRLVSEDGRGAVALVDVAVDDGNARDCAFAQQDGGGDGDVVEDAVAFAAIAERVVRAAGEVGRNARLPPSRSSESFARRRERGADRAPRPLDHHFRPREADPPLRFGRKRAVRDPVDVAGVVDEPQRVPGNRLGERQVLGAQDALAEDPLAEQPVLRHRKAMLLGEWEDEGVGIESLHGGDAKVLLQCFASKQSTPTRRASRCA